jgi:hypothetical protein
VFTEPINSGDGAASNITVAPHFPQPDFWPATVANQFCTPLLALGISQEGVRHHGDLSLDNVHRKEDSDELFKRAVDAGAKEIMPMTDMFFGSREGRLTDPFGNVWTIATLKEEVAPEAMQRRMKAQGY